MQNDNKPADASWEKFTSLVGKIFATIVCMGILVILVVLIVKLVIWIW